MMKQHASMTMLTSWHMLVGRAKIQPGNSLWVEVWSWELWNPNC